MGQKDELVWLESPNHRFSVKVAWEQLIFGQKSGVMIKEKQQGFAEKKRGKK